MQKTWCLGDFGKILIWYRRCIWRRKFENVSGIDGLDLDPENAVNVIYSRNFNQSYIVQFSVHSQLYGFLEVVFKDHMWQSEMKIYYVGNINI